MLGIGSYISSTREYLYSVACDPANSDGIGGIGDVLDFGTADYSVSLWFKSDAWDEAVQYLFAKRQDANNRFELATRDSDKKILVVTRIAGVNSGQVIGASGGGDLEGTWVNVIVSCDRDTNLKLYVNGDTSTYGGTHTVDSSSGNFNNNGTLNFACQTNAGASSLNGNITDIAIWNVALDADAADAVYNSGKPFDLRFDRGNYDNSSALQGYWRCNDGSGSTVKDEVGSNDGTLINDAAFSTNTPDD